MIFETIIMPVGEHLNASMFKNIDLICPRYFSGLDLMFAYNDSKSTGIAFLGKYNNGEK